MKVGFVMCGQSLRFFKTNPGRNFNSHPTHSSHYILFRVAVSGQAMTVLIVSYFLKCDVYLTPKEG